MAYRSSFFYRYQKLIYKIILLTAATALTVYFFPKGQQYKYDFEQGEPWPHETLYAPFAFPISKTDKQIKKEKDLIRKQAARYFDLDRDVPREVAQSFDEEYKSTFPDTLDSRTIINLKQASRDVIDKVYKVGYIKNTIDLKPSHVIILESEQDLNENIYSNLTTPDEILNILLTAIDENDLEAYRIGFKELMIDILEENVTYDEEFTEQLIQDELSKVSTNQGLIPRDSRIIEQGEIVDSEKNRILKTLNQEYESETWTDSQYNWKLLGYILLVGIAFTMLLLFIHRYRPDIYNDNKKVTFIYFNVLVIVLLSTLIIRLEAQFLYVVPVCILPLILKAFFDARLGLFTHVITILVLSFIVPSGDEYLFLQIIAGIVTILTSSEIYKRANLFISVGQITLIYIVAYFAFYAIDQGGVTGWNWSMMLYFSLCGLALLFVQPLIYIYEKIFNLVSDVSLLELSDTNTKLLKELSNKAPGTFHHSLNVANLAEAAANEINANAMLVRVGALYHDIGKMANPTYFVENQGSGINPHDDMDPYESAEIIIGHVKKGIEIAKRNNLPDRIIDFIRTHHGTSQVYYFLKKAEEQDGSVDESKFSYPGPAPFSAETAILMICDSVEAASKSINAPTSIILDELVEKIVGKQLEEEQFLNADITLREIQQVKRVIKKKLANIYHLRIEYPE